ncbi:MAG: 16S rRNA (cytidine(1402)-2'-O)-methyltransferase [Rhodobacteraceae bacterium]|nr:MAG: 16S rRNA (cytidine(1402)-2'-O)-methyltransferase [Paracoccaceae bacterium]
METNLKAGLYLLSTPIGNRGDITIRTLEILKECDLIVSEDTRVARKLLSMYQISLDGRNLVSYSDNSNSYARRKIVESIHNSKSVALISDAGSPLISDPGYKLVCEVISSGADVHSIPGPSSVISALSLSGLPCDKFYFHGFLSSREKKILEELERLRDYSCTAIVFESSRRLIKTLKYIGRTFGQKHLVSVCREMTKKFEEIRRGTVEELLEEFDSREKVKGEVVLVIGAKTFHKMDSVQIDKYLHYELQTRSVKDTVEILSKTLSLSKRVLYDRALVIKNKLTK